MQSPFRDGSQLQFGRSGTLSARARVRLGKSVTVTLSCRRILLRADSGPRAGHCDESSSRRPSSSVLSHRDLNTVTVTCDTSILSQARPRRGPGLAACQWATVACRTLAEPGSAAAAALSLRGHGHGKPMPPAPDGPQVAELLIRSHRRPSPPPGPRSQWPGGGGPPLAGLGSSHQSELRPGHPGWHCTMMACHESDGHGHWQCQRPRPGRLQVSY
jgi:hypothetical protein